MLTLRRLVDEVRWFIQRGRRGWAEVDTWSLDTYLARVISESVAALRDREFANPCLGDDPPASCVGCSCTERWRCDLTTIINGFGSYADLAYEDEPAASYGLRVGLTALSDNFQRLWD